MRDIPLGAAVLAMALLASCAPRPAPPAPLPPPPPPPVQPPSPAPLPLDWQDAPLGAGDWSYGVEGGRPAAAFGSAAAFLVRCEPNRQVSLSRAGAAGNALIVRTTNADRTLPAAVQAAGLVATLNAADPLLDAIVFSRGRFAVEAAGAPLLILPAWPEPARVIEDCRG